MDRTHDDGPDHGPGPLLRGVRAVYRMLVVFGACWVPLPEEQLRRIMWGDEPGPVRGLSGPPPGHPERLCDVLELSELELRLMREMGVR